MVQQLIGIRHALVLKQLNIVVDQTVQRHLDRPWLRECRGVLKRSLIVHVGGIDQLEAFGDLQLIARKVSRAIEPRHGRFAKW